MAWTETCKIDANKQIDHLVEQDMSITDAIKKLSAESEIPFGTIQRWYYPRNEGRTDPTATTTQIDEKKGAGQGNEDTGQEWPTCSQCESNKVEKNSRTGKPNGNGLCRTCRRHNAEKKKQWREDKKTKFDQTPIDIEADFYWKEVAENLKNLIDNNDTGKIVKIKPETFKLVSDAIKAMGSLIVELQKKTIFSLK
jgi:hypothetical protein